MRGAQRIVGSVIALATLACTPQEVQTDATAPDPVEDDSVTAPSGGEGFVVECSSPADCVRQAADRCPNGYDFRDLGESGSITRSSERGGAFVFGNPNGAAVIGKEQHRKQYRDDEAIHDRVQGIFCVPVDGSRQRLPDVGQLRSAPRCVAQGRARCVRCVHPRPGWPEYLHFRVCGPGRSRYVEPTCEALRWFQSPMRGSWRQRSRRLLASCEKLATPSRSDRSA